MNKKYTIDLHMHSMLSDGKETPVEVINEKHSGYSPKLNTRVTEYFDENWKRCDPKQASYYRLVPVSTHEMTAFQKSEHLLFIT